METRYSEQGRIINKKVDDNFIKMYLGLEDIIDNFGAVQEYIEFEEKYFNQDVDFCLNCDIDRFTSEKDIIEKGKYLVVFK